jgi:hypothetical protein
MTKPIGAFRDGADAPKKASAPMKFKLTKMYQYVLTIPNTVGSLLMYGLQCLTFAATNASLYETIYYYYYYYYYYGRTVARLVEELRHKTGGFGFHYR